MTLVTENVPVYVCVRVISAQFWGEGGREGDKPFFIQSVSLINSLGAKLRWILESCLVKNSAKHMLEQNLFSELCRLLMGKNQEMLSFYICIPYILSSVLHIYSHVQSNTGQICGERSFQFFVA